MSDRPRLSVVIPAKDEAHRISSTVAEVAGALEALVRDRYEIIVVDDGSSDGTAVRAEEAGAVVVSLPSNRGKGAAVRRGMSIAQGAVVAYTDADLSYAPAQHLMRLLEAVEGGCGMAVGSRRHPDSVTLVETSVVRRLAGRVFNAAVAALVLHEVRDTQCGVKAFSAEAAEQIFGRSRIDGFAFDVELFAIAGLLGTTVCDVPVRLVSDEVSTIRVAPAAVRMVGDLLRIRRWMRSGAYASGVGGNDAEGDPGDR